MPVLELAFESKEESLSVSRFRVSESISGLFDVSIEALSPNDDLDLEAIVGKAAAFMLKSGMAHGGGSRQWSGVCCAMEQVNAETHGKSTYALQIVPALWLLTKRRNHRIFQHMSIPEIVKKIFGEWHVEATWKIDDGAYAKLEIRVQYGESDYAFVSRLLEEAGIAYWFHDDEKTPSKLILGDKAHLNDARPGGPIDSVDNPNQASEHEFVTKVRVGHDIRPGKVTIRDFDFRLKPDYKLLGASPAAPAPEDAYEQYHYAPGAFLFEGGKGGDTPVADDKGTARTDEKAGAARAERALSSLRAHKRAVSFHTNVADLAPGVIFAVGKHPRGDLGPGKTLLVTDFALEGTPVGEWSMKGRAVFSDKSFRPAQGTPKPQIHGVQSALVVGPAGQEIHTDEFGRVRVQFHWDREGEYDDKSSCWMRVSQGWAGAGFGMIMIPRVGQEVLVGFFEGDPDQPVVVGRVFNNTTRVPYKLPDNKTVSTWKSDSSPNADGFNEIKFEDMAGKEMVYVQAEKDLTKLVKHDENETTGNDRTVIVKHDLTLHVKHDRIEITDNDLVSLVKKSLMQHVAETLVQRIDKNLQLYVGESQDIQIKKTKKELIEGESHLHVKVDAHEKIDGDVSLVIDGDRNAKIGKSDAVEIGKELHIKAGTKIILEAGSEICLKGPGGFVEIDSGGVTIKGSMVKINSGGGAGSGKGSKPVDPKDAEEAKVEDPKPPEDFSEKK